MKNFYLELPLDEKRRILEMHSKESKIIKEQSSTLGLAGTGFPNYGTSGELNINPKNLKLGDGGRNHPEQIKDVTNLQNILISKGLLKLVDAKGNKIKPGYFGRLTQTALDRYYGKEVPTEQKNQNESTICIGLDKKMCKKISPTNIVEVGTGEEAQCAAFVTKCLSEYDKKFITGDAWKSASFLTGGGGTERFNAFKTNVDWNKVWTELKSSGITKKDCMSFYKKQNSDVLTFAKGARKILAISENNAPDSSSINWKSLKPGDIVGLWHKSTTNKGRAFCERMVDDLNLDDNGKFKELPFTFNTHVGFVTAIKNGVPIIVHNIGNMLHTSGTFSAVPVTKMLSKDSPDRIVWAVSDPEVESAYQEMIKKQQSNPSNFFNLSK